MMRTMVYSSYCHNQLGIQSPTQQGESSEEESFLEMEGGTRNAIPDTK